MKSQLKLSDRDRKLLFLLFSLLVIAGSYFFIYTKNLSESKEINESNKVLKARVGELKRMQSEMIKDKKLIEKYTDMMEEIKDQFPATLNTEDAIVMIDDIEKSTNVKLSSINFKMNEVFYSTNANVAVTSIQEIANGQENSTSSQATTNQASSGTANMDSSNTQVTDGAAVDSTTASDAVGATNSEENLIGYQSTVTFEYKASYEGLKAVIDYIYDNTNRMSIGNMTVTFDSDTGDLTGEMSILMYSLAGTGKVYKEPFVDGIDTGNSNMFGTLEIQEHKK
ncbi:MAG TPA: hypothetical protein VHP81_00440 [Lachnospiraceae bacterium]|nr:hypothetical protein [Lachnospiraceae bacterium]